MFEIVHYLLIFNCYVTFVLNLSHTICEILTDFDLLRSHLHAQKQDFCPESLS